MATEPLNKANQEQLPVNVRKITDKRHVVVRLDQVQRGILKHPAQFESLDADRSLQHIRTEVRQLQAALTQHALKQVEYAFTQLQRTFKLMQSWSAEEELSDVLTLDHHRYDALQAEKDACEIYPDYIELLPRLTAERERLYHKYSGFFENRGEELKVKQEETRKKLKPCQPKMEEARQRMESFKSVQQEINYYAQRSTNALVGGMGALLGLTLVGYVSGIWGGWFWGFLLGYTVFSNIASLYTDVRNKPMLEMYTFLKCHYEIKNLKPFFAFENKEKPEEPTRFDASKGEALARFMQKDVSSASKDYSQWERQHTEHVGYLQYLEGQRAWSDDQLRRLKEISQDVIPELEAAAPKKEPVEDTPPVDLASLQAPPEPAKPVSQEPVFATIPEPADSELEKRATSPAPVVKKSLKKAVRPAKMPDRAS